MPLDLAIVGSINHDITVFTESLPVPGETVLGSEHFSANGGKGANQAVAAARLGSSVAMFGRVGSDENGRVLIDALQEEGVDTEGITVDEQVPTGLAVITVDSSAENTIVVSPGANQSLTPRDVTAHADTISSAGLVLAQLEVPLKTVMAAAEIARGRFCLNPAPSRKLPQELLQMVDVLIPNRSELAALAGVDEPVGQDEINAAVDMIEFDGAIVVTLGADGAMVFESGAAVHAPAPGVEAVDPTGAGDAFCGALVHGLAHGDDLESAVGGAVVVGALATTRRGAQPSMPTSDQVNAFRQSL